MALNDVKFIKGSGNVGSSLTNEDHVSGMLFYLPQGESSPGDFEGVATLIGSVAEAEAEGIITSDDRYVVMHYQISEFFRLNPTGELWVYATVIPTEGIYTFVEIETLVNATNGRIRQMAIMLDTVFSNGHIATIQTIVEALESEHKPISVIYSADMSALELDELVDLRSETSNKVSVVIGQDGAGVGNDIFQNTFDYSIPCTGAVLGAISKAAVHECIAWPEKFRMSGTELDTIAFATGVLYTEVAESLLNALNTKGYIFLRKHIGMAGSYLNDSHTCISLTSDYSSIELNRTIDKATRGIRTFLLPKLNSPLEVNPVDGTLSIDTIKYFENLAGKPLEQMAKNGEVSGYKVTINSNQNVLVSSKLDINVTLVAKGVARNIVVNIGFGTSV